MQIQVTDDLKSQAYQDALAIRKTVFIQEQHVPASIEVDHEDQAIYFVAYDDGLALGTARIMKEDYGYHIQRVAVLKSFRHHGVGKALLTRIAAYAQENQIKELRLDAQVSAVGFYKAIGFELTDKPEFIEAGIHHRQMHQLFD